MTVQIITDPPPPSPGTVWAGLWEGPGSWTGLPSARRHQGNLCARFHCGDQEVLRAEPSHRPTHARWSWDVRAEPAVLKWLPGIHPQHIWLPSIETKLDWCCSFIGKCTELRGGEWETDIFMMPWWCTNWIITVCVFQLFSVVIYKMLIIYSIKFHSMKRDHFIYPELIRKYEKSFWQKVHKHSSSVDQYFTDFQFASTLRTVDMIAIISFKKTYCGRPVLVGVWAVRRPRPSF